VSFVLSVNYTECRKQSHFAECHFAECHYAECRYAECHGAVTNTLVDYRAEFIAAVKKFYDSGPWWVFIAKIRICFKYICQKSKPSEF